MPLFPNLFNNNQTPTDYTGEFGTNQNYPGQGGFNYAQPQTPTPDSLTSNPLDNPLAIGPNQPTTVSSAGVREDVQKAKEVLDASQAYADKQREGAPKESETVKSLTDLETGFGDDFDAFYTSFQRIRNSIGLTPEQQRAIDDTSALFQQLKDKQQMLNDDFVKATERIGERTGLQRYAPGRALAEKTGAIQKGIEELESITLKENAAISEMRAAFDSKNVDELFKAYDLYNDMQDRKRRKILDIHETTLDLQKEQRDQEKFQLELKKLQLDIDKAKKALSEGDKDSSLRKYVMDNPGLTTSEYIEWADKNTGLNSSQVTAILNETQIATPSQIDSVVADIGGVNKKKAKKYLQEIIDTGEWVIVGSTPSQDITVNVADDQIQEIIDQVNDSGGFSFTLEDFD